MTRANVELASVTLVVAKFPSYSYYEEDSEVAIKNEFYVQSKSCARVNAVEVSSGCSPGFTGYPMDSSTEIIPTVDDVVVDFDHAVLTRRGAFVQISGPCPRTTLQFLLKWSHV